LRTKSARTENRPEKEKIIGAVEAAREEAGLSQRELSRRLGLHEMTIMRFANGERMLDILEFVDIARALGRKPGEFLDSIVN
jgi:transcriptional regulator with XRE-family HTH domain